MVSNPIRSLINLWRDVSHATKFLDQFSSRQKLEYNGGGFLNFKLFLFTKSTIDVVPILQGLSYMLCSIVSPKFFHLVFFILVLGISTIILIACCYAVTTSKIGLYFPRKDTKHFPITESTKWCKAKSVTGPTKRGTKRARKQHVCGTCMTEIL